MTDGPSYRVGQVLFVIPQGKALIVPMQVLERRTSETITGVIVQHVVKSPKEKAEPVFLESVKGMVFHDLGLARSTMVKNATQAIDAMVRQAQARAQQAFAPPPPPAMPTPDEGMIIDDEWADGASDAQSAVLTEASPTRALVPMNGSANADPMTEIMLPDGSKQIVRLKVS